MALKSNLTPQHGRVIFRTTRVVAVTATQAVILSGVLVLAAGADWNDQTSVADWMAQEDLGRSGQARTWITVSGQKTRLLATVTAYSLTASRGHTGYVHR